MSRRAAPARATETIPYALSLRPRITGLFVRSYVSHASAQIYFLRALSPVVQDTLIKTQPRLSLQLVTPLYEPGAAVNISRQLLRARGLFERRDYSSDKGHRPTLSARVRRMSRSLGCKIPARRKHSQAGYSDICSLPSLSRASILSASSSRPA